MTEPPRLRIGLALGSGAARGWAHIGVMRALSKLKIQPDVVCGTSVGALVGGCHLSGNLDALEDWALGLTRLGMVRYLDFRFPGKGLIAGNRLFTEMEKHLGDVLIEDLPIPFAGVATDLYTGHEYWLTRGRLVDAIRASFSLPAFFEPARFKGRWMLDGALVNPVPVSVCRALGTPVVIAVNLNAAAPPISNGRNGNGLSGSHEDLSEKDGKTAKTTMKANGSNGAAPSLLGVMAATMNISQDRVTRSRLAGDPPDVNVVPKVGHIGMLDFYRAEEAINAGEAAVYQAESEIRATIGLFEGAFQ